MHYTANRMAIWGWVIALLAAPAAQADNITIVEENDWFYDMRDRDYTQGARISYTFDVLPSESAWNERFNALARYLPLFDGKDSRRQVEWIVLGQNIYTPRNKARVNPDPNDRPYAGWLYMGGAFMEDHGGASLDYVELLVGVVGPAALAKETQRRFHDLSGDDYPQGWDYQLDNEPGITLSLEKKWRLHQLIGSSGSLGVEAIPEGGVTLGNVWTYAQTGVLFRFGENLLANYGTPRVRPALSGTSYFNPEAMKGDWGWNIYAGAQARAVAQNIFLDGNTFSDSRSVDKKPFAGTAHAGVSLYMQEGPNFDFAYVWCSKEFDISRDCSHYGGINLGWNF